MHEPEVVGVLVVAFVGGSISELHRDREAIAILWADLSQQLEELDAWNCREPLRGVEEVTFSSRSLRMDERERNGMPDAVRVDPSRLLSVRRIWRMCRSASKADTRSVVIVRTSSPTQSCVHIRDDGGWRCRT